MLRALRRYSSSAGVRVLYGLLALTFVAWGAGTMGNRMSVIAEVRGERITRADLAREAGLLEQRVRKLTGGNQAPAGFDFEAQALDALITDALLRQEASRLGLGVSDDELVATITEMPELQRNGHFDRDMLERFLEFQRDRGEFESEIRRRLLVDRIRGLIVDGVEPSDAEIRQEYELQFSKVSLDFVRITPGDVASDLTVTDEALETYRTANRDRYLGPPRVRARYVVFPADTYGDLATPSPSAIEEYYQARLDQDFTKAEQVKARHVLVRVAPDASDEERAAARTRAEEIRDEIAGGADFAEVARERSDDTGSGAQGGNLGWFPRGRMAPAFETAAFALEPGELSDVVETSFGFHVIEVQAHDPGGPQPLADVRDEIVTMLARDRGIELARKDAEAARRAIVDGHSLAEAAGERPVHETEPFSKGTFVPGLGAAPAFNEAAFALAENEVSDLVEETSGIYILSPFGRTERTLPPLDEIRPRVEADYRQEQAAELAQQQAEAVLARAREVGLATAAMEHGLVLESTGEFARRDGTIPELGSVPSLREAIAALEPQAPLAPEVYVAGRDAVVVALAEREAPDPAGLAAERDALAETIRRRQRTQAFARYIDLLKQRAQDAGALTVRADALG